MSIEGNLYLLDRRKGRGNRILSELVGRLAYDRDQRKRRKRKNIVENAKDGCQQI